MGLRLDVRLIVVSPLYEQKGPGDRVALEREVRREMERKGGSVTSASGMTAALAVNYCERRGLSYEVRAHAVTEGGGLHYHVRRVETSVPGAVPGQNEEKI